MVVDLFDPFRQVAKSSRGNQPLWNHRTGDFHNLFLVQYPKLVWSGCAARSKLKVGCDCHAPFRRQRSRRWFEHNLFVQMMGIHGSLSSKWLKGGNGWLNRRIGELWPSVWGDGVRGTRDQALGGHPSLQLDPSGGRADGSCQPRHALPVSTEVGNQLGTTIFLFGPLKGGSLG